MTNLPASLAARFSSFAAIAALTLSTVLGTGCAQGADIDGTEGNDVPAADASSEQTRLTTPGRLFPREAAVRPRGLASVIDPKDAFAGERPAPAAKIRALGDGIEVPSDAVAVPPHQVPRTVAKPTLREMGEPIAVPSGYVAGAPEQLPGAVVNEGSEPTMGHELEVPPGSPDLALEAACDRDGRCPTWK